jgi:hypothetical protein
MESASVEPEKSHDVILDLPTLFNTLIVEKNMENQFMSQVPHSKLMTKMFHPLIQMNLPYCKEPVPKGALSKHSSMQL